MAIQPAQINPSLVPPLVPTSVAVSTLLTSVIPTSAMLTPATSIATAMPSASIVADTRPTYVSLGVPLTSTPPLVSATAAPTAVTTASAPPPLLPPVSQDPGIGGPPPPPSGTVSSVASSPRANILDTDACDVAVGAVLSQRIDGMERPIAFFSRVMNDTQKNYCTTRRELLPVICALQHLR